MRSLLLLAPGSRDAALRANPDALVIDLSAATPETAEATRREALAVLRVLPEAARPPRIIVRIHPLASPLSGGDLDVVLLGRPDMIWLPAAAGGDEVAFLDARLAVREALHGLEDGMTRIIASAGETPASLFTLASFSGASRRLAALAWSPEPLAAALGQAAGDALPLDQARFMVIAAAHAAGLSLIASGVPPPGTADMLRRDCALLAREGFAGRLARDPADITILNATFAAPVVAAIPTEDGQLDLLADAAANAVEDAGAGDGGGTADQPGERGRAIGE